MNIEEQKTALRSELRARRVTVSPDLQREREQMIWGNIVSRLPQFRTAKTLLFYFPLAHEIDLLPVFNHARELGIACALPRCGDQKGDMDFYYVDSLADQTVKGKFGIYEPRRGTKKVTDLSDALVFVPAFAYDRDGFRLGYGGGYYDRFLATYKVFSVGVTFEEFLSDSLPREAYDFPVDCLVTERDIYPIQK